MAQIKESIINEVEYYVSCDNVTKEDVANEFKRSLSSVKKDFANFRKFNEANPNNPHYKLYLKEKEKSKKSEMLGKIKGGMNPHSGRTRVLTLEETLKIAKHIVANGYTLDDASSAFGIPRSTLHESLNRLGDLNDKEIIKIYEMIQENYEKNKSVTNFYGMPSMGFKKR